MINNVVLDYMSNQSLQYNVIFRPEPEGGFTALVPSLPGCISYGKDLALAREMIADAIGLYIASLKDDDEPIPNDNESVIGLVQVPNGLEVEKVQHA